MIRKHILHLSSVALKYFFDFDQNTLIQAFCVAQVVFCLIKMYTGSVATYFIDGIYTVKEDALYIRAKVAEIHERWEISNTMAAISQHVRNIKENLAQDSRVLRMKIGGLRMSK